MPTNLLLLPLLGGYWFVHWCHFMRFRGQRLDGYRLLIGSSSRRSISQEPRPFRWSWVSWRRSRSTGVVDQPSALARAVHEHGDELLRLLQFASLNSREVSIALDNRKVYIGYITKAPNLAPHEGYVSLLPVLSGYRDSGTLELHFTIDYSGMFQRTGEVNPDNFVVTVTLSSNKMASLFDRGAYAKFRILETTHSPEPAPEDDPNVPAFPVG